MVAALLALAAAVGWGSADFLGGLKSKTLPLTAVIIVSQGAALLVVVAAVAGTGEGPPAGRYVLYGVLAGLAGTAGILALYRGLAVGAMGIVAPITATGAAIPVAVGVARGERPGWVQAAGLVLACIGVVLASLEPGARSGVRAPIAAGVGLALAAAVAIGLFFTALDAASDGSVLWALLLQHAVLVPLVLAGAIVRRDRLTLAPRDLRTVLAIGALHICANALFAYASTRGLISLVAVLGSLYPVTTVVLARVVLGERHAAIQRAGVVAALAGVVLITAG
jgi:drug/metabolite transporter (DMT)-like permease